MDNEGTRPLGGAARSAVRGEPTSPPRPRTGEDRSAKREGTLVRRLLVMVSVALANVALANVALATEYDASPNDYRQSVKRLRAGDTLRLAAGEYREGLAVHELSGVSGRPIVIAGPAQGPPAVFVAQAGRNTVSIVD